MKRVELSQFPSADGEYTPEQRRMIDARLDEADEDIEAGRARGPFTAKEARVHIERIVKERAAERAKRSRR